jgi:hypothetical protein
MFRLMTAARAVPFVVKKVEEPEQASCGMRARVADSMKGLGRTQRRAGV